MPALLDLLPQDGIKVHKVSSTHGGEYTGPCPLCGGKDRFHIWPEEGDGGKYWCRGCEKGGDLIQYLRDVRKLSYVQACLEAGIKPEPMKSSFDWGDSEDKMRKWEPRVIEAPPNEWIRKCSSFVDWAHDRLMECPEIRSYLRSKRGLTDETIKVFHLGWNPHNLERSRLKWGLEDKVKEDGTVVNVWLPQGIVIPYFVDGILQRARIRRLNQCGHTPEHGPAYAIVSGSTSAAMIPEEPCKVLVVVESEFDAILLQQELGTLAGVVAMGSASARPDRVAYELLIQADLILVALDSDDQREDGQNPGAKEAQWWLQRFQQARRLPPIEGKDPGEMWANGVDLSQWVAIGINKYYPAVRSNIHAPVAEAREIPFDVLNAIATQAYREIAEIYPQGKEISVSGGDFEKVDEVWRLCMIGQATLQNFRAALGIWSEGWKQAINAYKEVQN